MAFQIHALDADQFRHLFELSDADLTQHRAVRQIVDVCPGAPCRVSLEDAKVGEEVILVGYRHMEQATPYRAEHAVFVRKGAEVATPLPGQVPELFRHRLISLRGFDASGMMVEADAVEGTDLEAAIEKLFDDQRVDIVHLHYAKPGCFAAKVTRSPV